MEFTTILLSLAVISCSVMVVTYLVLKEKRQPKNSTLYWQHLSSSTPLSEKGKNQVLWENLKEILDDRTTKQ